MHNKRKRLYLLSALFITIISIAYVFTGVTTYKHLQLLNKLQAVLNNVKLYDCSISAQAELLRNGVHHSKEEQQKWKDELQLYNEAMNDLFTHTLATSPSKKILLKIPTLQELWEVSYKRIKFANSHMSYFDYVPAGEALTSTIELKRDKLSREELYKLGQLNYELEAYDDFLKDVLTEKLNAISHDIQDHIHDRKLKLTMLILFMIPAISLIMILLLLALMRAENRNHQRIEQLQKMQKLESLGRATGRISHDFKNILTGIIGFTDLAKMEENYPEPLGELIDEIAQAAHRAVELSSSITSFTKDDLGSFEKVEIGALLAEVNRLVKVSIPPRVECVIHTPNQKFTINGNAIQLYQVFMNLAINASHAISDKGQIVLSAKEKNEDTLSITVSDTGCGIAANQLSHIFESGYTTKEKAHGSGFGLFIVQEVINHHSGSISVESTPGEGTTFTIELPLT